MRLCQLVFPLSLALAACGGSSNSSMAPRSPEPPPPAADPIPKTAGPPCKEAIDHLLTLVEPDQNKQELAKHSELMVARCEGDRWSDEARSCLATAQSDSELDGCAELLTAAQRDAMVKAAGEQDSSEAAAPPPPPAPGAPQPAAVMPPASAPAPKPPARPTRGGVKKDKDKRTDDPCQGGE